MKAEHLRLGKDAETACCDYLKSHGLKLVDKNYNCRFGEIDIIMTDDNMLVFVEVRYRKNSKFGGGLESITPTKQQKLRKSAELYLQKNRQYQNARLDVVSMSADTSSQSDMQQFTFDWIKNAF
jgi:putative endonuclease